MAKCDPVRKQRVTDAARGAGIVAAVLWAAAAALGAGRGEVKTPEGKPGGGIALAVSVSTASVGHGEDFTIAFHVRNASDKPIRLIALDRARSRAFPHYHKFVFYYRLKAQRQWHWIYMEPPLPPAKAAGDGLETIPPGRTRVARFHADRQRAFVQHIEGKTYVATWPPMPGRYVIRAMFLANGDMKKARAAGVWTARANSGEAELVVRPFEFLQVLKDDASVTQKEIDALYRQAIKRPRLATAVEKLIRIGDRKACTALLKLLRDRACPPTGVAYLGKRLGEAIAYDLLRLTRQGMWARQLHAAGRALGRIGSAKVIAAVGAAVNDTTWHGRAGFLVGLGESRTKASLALLKELAVSGTPEAVAALAQRPEDAAEAALLAAMKADDRLASDHAAQRLAARGKLEAVRWLAAHWHWNNAAAFVAAPIRWPDPAKGMIDKAQAAAAARRALPALKDPAARYLDGRWYVVSVAGRPDVRGHFLYVILDARSAKVLAKDAHRVLR